MPKNVITERDIEELAREGKTSLDLDGDSILTELAYEKARALGIQLGASDPGAPSAPIRPYLSKFPQTPAPRPAETPLPQAPIAAIPVVVTQVPAGTPCAFCLGKAELDLDALRVRLRKAALAKMGDSMDPALIDTIIERVLANVGLK
jgi:hypothetical protein